ncbi:MAG: hypothetical protein NTV34_13255 [Proteobacteria bacterium]|nr:hypothetical protein [Pseudomonadota bacterium]
MYLNTVIRGLSLLLVVGCSGVSPKSGDSESPAPAAVAPEATAPAPAVTPSVSGPSEYAILRAPVDQSGAPDLSKAELRTGLTEDTKLEDGVISATFSTLGKESVTKVANADELDATSSTESWYLLPWRARVAAGVPVRRGPYLLPWRRAIANSYGPGPVQAVGYISPYRVFATPNYTFFMYGYGPSCVCVPPPCCVHGGVGYPGAGAGYPGAGYPGAGGGYGPEAGQLPVEY